MYKLTLTKYLIALWIYDYSLTLPDEINFVWTCNISVAGIMFLLNRYAFMLYILQLLIVTAAVSMSNLG